MAQATGHFRNAYPTELRDEFRQIEAGAAAENVNNQIKEEPPVKKPENKILGGP